MFFYKIERLETLQTLDTDSSTVQIRCLTELFYTSLEYES